VNSEKNFKFILVFISLILTFYVTLRIDLPNHDLKLKRHTRIISNNIEYPYKFRLLNPFITEAWFTAGKLLVPEKSAFILAYTLQNFLVFLLLIFSVSKFFAIWFDKAGVLISVLIFTIITFLSFTGYDVLGDMTTAGLMALGFRFIVTEKTKFLFPLIFIGAFNELQIIILALCSLFSIQNNLTSGKAWVNFICLILTFTVSYFLIFLMRGGTTVSSEIIWYFTKDAEFNLAHPEWIVLWVILIFPLLLPVFRNIKSKPEFLRRTFYFILPVCYMISFFFIARMREIDKALTIFIILIPLAIYTLLPQHNKRSD
jgi:hypothetical protein